MPDMNANAETQQEYFGKAKLKTDYKDLSIRLYKRIAELEKSCDETQELLDKQIEATYKLDKENAEAKNLIEELASSLSVVGECDKKECELIDKAQRFINKPIF